MRLFAGIRRTRGLCALVMFALLVLVAHGAAQSALAITTAHARDLTVDGTADPAAGPITILDVSYEAETPLGTGEVAADGKFAAAVYPPLLGGHRLVAVDSRGRRSEPFVVAPPRQGPVPSAD